MLVSHSHKFIFLKTGKTAGTSTEVFFQPACMPKGAELSERTEMMVSEAGIVGYRGGAGQDLKWRNHMPAATIRAQLESDVWQSYFKFMNVRNPFTRAVSLYAFHQQRSRRTLPQNWDTLRADFGRFLLSDGYGLQTALFQIDGTCVVDDVIYYESLKDDIRRIADHVGYCAPIQDLRHTKKGQHGLADGDIADLYNRTLVGRVLDVEATIFDLMGYSDDPYDADQRPAHPSAFAATGGAASAITSQAAPR